MRKVLIHDWTDDVTLYPFTTDQLPDENLFHCRASGDLGPALKLLVSIFDIDYEPERGESLSVEEMGEEIQVDFSEVLS